VPDNDLLPAHGIYAGIAILDNDIKYPAATYVGTRPSFEGEKTVFETHLIGFSGDLYDRHLTVEIYRKTRSDIKFEDLNDLSKQIKIDIADSLAFFSRHLEEEFMAGVIMP
jgi:riboflavin kinase/FMN adenylyltransferase